ncbi:MAG: heme-dependent peroxidase, partial [Pirellulales bacterium]|nr:heme-dependent peroxidase [Pirellulales bacterium]
MNARPPASGHGQPLPEPSVIPEHGWHCAHYFYRFRRAAIDSKLNEACRQQMRDALAPSGEHAV